MPQDDTDKHPASLTDYLILGGGVAGCALTYALSRRGASVTLVERGGVAQQGASSVPVALLNPYRGRSARAAALDLAGLAAMKRLTRDLEEAGLEHGVRWCGVLRLASNRKQAKTWRKREGVRWLEPEEVEGVYHAPFGGFLVEDGGWLEPHLFLRTLAAAATQRGAKIVERCEVREIGEGEGEPYRVVKTSSGTFYARTLIFCTGASPDIEEKLGVGGLEHVAGEVIRLNTDIQLPHALAGAIYGAQVNEHVYLGGNHRLAAQTDETAPRQLQRAGSWFIPALEGAELSAVWTGVRAKAEDNRPVVQEMRKGVWFFGALAGRGFLCTAHLAEGLAETLVSQRASV